MFERFTPDARRAIVLATLGETSDDGLALVNVEGGGNLGPVLAEAKHRVADVGKVSYRLDRADLVSNELASIAFTVDVESGPSLLETGTAVKVAGRWLVSRDTFCQLVAKAGVHCPPPPS